MSIFQCIMKLSKSAVDKVTYDRADWDSIKQDIISLMNTRSDFNIPMTKL